MFGGRRDHRWPSEITDAPDEQEKFKMGYDYREPVKSGSLRIGCWR